MVLPANMGPMITCTSPEVRVEGTEAAESLVKGIEGLKEAMDLGLQKEKGLKILGGKKRGRKESALMIRINSERSERWRDMERFEFERFGGKSQTFGFGGKL